MFCGRSSLIPKQEVFDTIVSHLRAQKDRSTRVVKYWKRDEIECAYRGDEGKKCPGGLLIEDKEYAAWMESVAFTSILSDKEAPKSLKERHSENGELIETLIFMHDFSPPSDWEEELSNIASAFSLTYAADA